MEEKTNFATLIHEQAVPATGKGAAGLRDELGQDSAELCWIQLPPQEGRAGRDRGTRDLRRLGARLPSTATSSAIAPLSGQWLSLSSGVGKAGSKDTDILLHPSSPCLPSPPFCHFAVYWACWIEAFIDIVMPSFLTVLVISCYCYNISLAYTCAFQDMEHVLIPQTQIIPKYQKLQYNDK